MGWQSTAKLSKLGLENNLNTLCQAYKSTDQDKLIHDPSHYRLAEYFKYSTTSLLSLPLLVAI